MLRKREIYRGRRHASAFTSPYRHATADALVFPAQCGLEQHGPPRPTPPQTIRARGPASTWRPIAQYLATPTTRGSRCRPGVPTSPYPGISRSTSPSRLTFQLDPAKTEPPCDVYDDMWVRSVLYGPDDGPHSPGPARHGQEPSAWRSCWYPKRMDSLMHLRPARN